MLLQGYKAFHDSARFARPRRAFEPPNVGQDSLRTILFLGLPGVNLPTDLAERAVPHFWSKHRICDHCRHGLYAWLGNRQPGGWLDFKKTRNQTPSVAGGH